MDENYCKSSRGPPFFGSFLAIAFQEQGAATTVYCAVAPELTPENGGLYYDDCRPRVPTGTARDAANAEKLWSLSEQMLQKYQEKARES